MVRLRLQDRKAPGTSHENPLYEGQPNNYMLVLKHYFKSVSKVDQTLETLVRDYKASEATRIEKNVTFSLLFLQKLVNSLKRDLFRLCNTICTVQ